MSIKSTLSQLTAVNTHFEFAATRVFAVIVLAAMAVSLAGCLAGGPAKPGPEYYSAKSIEAWVVDADTGEPVAGVNVVAQWILRGGIHEDETGLLMIMEDVTDENGRFSFPAWGPVKRPYDGYLGSADPRISLYKYEYRFRSVGNRPDASISHEPLRTSRWNGKQIELRRFDGSLRGYAKTFSFASTALRFVVRGENCHWREIPQMLIALDDLRRHFLKNNIGSRLHDIRDIQSYEAECGSPRQFFDNYARGKGVRDLFRKSYA